MANLFEACSHLDSQLSSYLSSNNISPSNISSAKSLLKSWSPSIESLSYSNWNQSISSQNTLESIPEGLYSLTFTVVDQKDTEYMYGYYIQEGILRNLRYGAAPQHEIQPVEDVLFERQEVQPAIVPGDREVILPRVYLYDHLAKNTKLNAVVRLVGIYSNEEFHAIYEEKEEEETGDFSVREDVLEALKRSLGGDQLAAECVLMGLISRILDRNTLIGKISINLIGLTDCQPFSDYITHLTSTKQLNLTLQMLDSQSFISKKDCDTGDMHFSPLQVPISTVLLLSEYYLSPGNLHETGLRNIQTIRNFISQSSLPYDFGVYNLDFEVDNPVIILSEGKSLFPSDLHLPIVSTYPPTHYEHTPLHLQYLKAARKVQCTLPDEIAKLAESEFVERRRGEGMEPEELHRVIVFARYLSMSYGLTEVSHSTWIHALQLHDELKQREIRSN